MTEADYRSPADISAGGAAAVSRNTGVPAGGAAAFAAFRKNFLSMVDISCVQGCHSREELERMCELAAEYHCAAVFALPSVTPYLFEYTRAHPIRIGGVVSFPSGGAFTEDKAAEARRLRELGCCEIDMVINQTALRLHRDETVREDIAAVREAADLPLKVILEVNNLTEEEIVRGCRLAEEAGARFVKSGTGWNQKPTTVGQIRWMRGAVSPAVQVKAAGGVRSLATAFEMYQAGCTRFGIGVGTLDKLLNSDLKDM